MIKLLGEFASNPKAAMGKIKETATALKVVLDGTYQNIGKVFVYSARSVEDFFDFVHIYGKKVVCGTAANEYYNHSLFSAYETHQIRKWQTFSERLVIGDLSFSSKANAACLDWKRILNEVVKNGDICGCVLNFLTYSSTLVLIVVH